MKVPVLIVPVCLFFFIFGPACSREDQPPGHPPSPKVVQTIKPLPEHKEEPVAELERDPEGPKEEIEVRPQHEPPARRIDVAVKEVTVAEKAQTTADEMPEIPKNVEEAQAGVYVVREGDTLAGIAARPEIMQDPLKWLTLLRLNRDKFGDQSIGADFAARELPPGMRLRIISPREVKEGVETASEFRWAVNVMSASGATEEEIISPATLLARNGFPAYITHAHVKGKDYLRLRVGFFQSKREAIDQGEKIRELLGIDEVWVTKVSTGEYEEWAGFLEAP
jgi:hypothetical protein